MRDLKNIEMHELIGVKCEVIYSTNKLQEGIGGNIINETYHTIVIRDDKGDKIIQKKGAKFRIEINGNRCIVKGDRIHYRPHERTKKLVWRRKKW